MDLRTRIPVGTSHLERSFLIQRTGMAILAALFPVAFLVSSFIFNRTSFQSSISAYYWTLDIERDIFVGGLCALAIFLVLYKGYTKIEDRLLDLAGLSAAGIAFFPTNASAECSTSVVSAHGVFSVLFFSCIFLVSITMSRKSLREIADLTRRQRFKRAYKWCSGIMVGAIALAISSRLLPTAFVIELCDKSAIFWFEAVGIWAFSAYWYIKTRELDPDRSWFPFVRKKHHRAND